MSDEPEIYIDPYDGGTVPCVMCMAAPQLVGSGVCSEECADELEKWIEEENNDCCTTSKAARSHDD